MRVRRFILSLFGVLLISWGFMTAAHAQQVKLFDMLPVYRDGQLIERGVFRDKVPRFEDLRANAARTPTYESFLDELYAQAPALRQNYVLIHASESQQLSSITHPRVVVFGGGMAFGLSDDPRQKDRRIEIMQVDPRNYEVSLHEIIFHETGPEFVENPVSCAACHGLRPKPLWNPYDFWPNTFGSAIGFIGTEQEATAYQKIYQGRAQAPSLRGLTLTPEINLDTENVSAFTQYIHQLNLGRFSFQNLGANSGIDDYAEPLMAVLSLCAVDSSQRASFEKLREYFHPEDVSRLPPMDRIRQDVEDGRAHFKSFLDVMQGRLFPNANVKFKVDHSRLADETGVLSQIHYIFALAGVDGSNLSTSLVANDYLISAPSNMPIDFFGSFYEARPELFRGVKVKPEFLLEGRESWLRVDCESLKTRSRQRRRVFADLRNFRSFRRDQPARPVISRCAKCHVEGLDDSIDPAPRIPFDQPARLAELLQKPNARLRERIFDRVEMSRGTAKQMPPEHPLSASEVESLLTYLKHLEGPSEH